MSFLDNIKAIPITDYAQRCGYTLIRKGNRYISLKEHDSVMIDVFRNCFWRNSTFQKGMKGGAGSVIDFAMEFNGFDLNKALRELAVMYGIEGDKKTEVTYNKSPLPSLPKKRDIGDLALPPKAEGMKEVFHYLLKERKIDISVVRYFVAKKMLYQDAKHNNCVFISHKFGCIRSTSGKKYAFDLEGCDYNECFFFRPSESAKTLVVAESVIDIMSIMTQFVKEKRKYTNYCYLALAGTNKIPSLFYHLEKEKDIDCIMLAFDNDSAGEKATTVALERLKAINYKGCIELYVAPNGEKDWNEYLKKNAE